MFKIIIKLKERMKLKQFKALAKIGNNFKIYHCSGCYAEKKNLIEIGNNCEIAGVLYSMDEGKITIGDYTEIREHTFVGSVDRISIGNYVIISNNIKIYDNNNHPTSPSQRKKMCQNGFSGEQWKWTYSDRAPVIIEDNVWIGERSTILKGVTIGRGSIVACNSVVTKDVPPYSIVAGNPAKVVKQLENDNEE